MADKKLSDVTSVEDFDYFLGVKSNGDVQKMSKDSMKKVISELMSSFLQIDSPKNFIVSNPSNMETGIISIGDASREISKSEKLNEPSEDIPFIRGMDSNGNPIYIGTEQFSSVLAGLMGVGFLEKGNYQDINEVGTYTTYSNTPQAGPVFSIQCGDSCIQESMSYGGYSLMVRSYNHVDGKWNEWKSIAI